MIPKFRAWDKDSKVMREIQHLVWAEDNLIAHCPPRGHEFSEWFTVALDGSEYQLMQYTGLKDKNGVEIYEGDVLFHPLQGRRKVFYPYSETVASYGLRNIDNGFGSTLQDSHAVWEVIGNIYENLELLS